MQQGIERRLSKVEEVRWIKKARAFLYVNAAVASSINWNAAYTYNVEPDWQPDDPKIVLNVNVVEKEVVNIYVAVKEKKTSMRVNVQS